MLWTNSTRDATGNMPCGCVKNQELDRKVLGLNVFISNKKGRGGPASFGGGGRPCLGCHLLLKDPLHFSRNSGGEKKDNLSPKAWPLPKFRGSHKTPGPWCIRLHGSTGRAPWCCHVLRCPWKDWLQFVGLGIHRSSRSIPATPSPSPGGASALE